MSDVRTQDSALMECGVQNIIANAKNRSDPPDAIHEITDVSTHTDIVVTFVSLPKPVLWHRIVAPKIKTRMRSAILQTDAMAMCRGSSQSHLLVLVVVGGGGGGGGCHRRKRRAQELQCEPAMPMSTRRYGCPGHGKDHVDACGGRKKRKINLIRADDKMPDILGMSSILSSAACV
eukprot:SAG11_NODE_4414_length_1906_cov_1.158273_2_plen_176_part_00